MAETNRAERLGIGPYGVQLRLWQRAPGALVRETATMVTVVRWFQSAEDRSWYVEQIPRDRDFVAIEGYIDPGSDRLLGESEHVPTGEGV